MWGKHFESMYEGSMYGAGVPVFAVWGYVISHARQGKVELNARKLADTLGGTVEEVNDAITFLCSPDPNSRFKEHEGRRLLKEGEFQYVLPSWKHYQAIRNEIERREYNRLAKQKERARKDGAEPALSDSGDAFDIPAKIKRPMPPLEIVKALEGYKGTTHDLAAKLRELHSNDPPETEQVKQARINKVKAKIAREEEQEEEVKRRLDPNYGK